MDIHLVSIKICIERSTDTLIKPECIAGRYFGPKAHHTDPMQTGLPIEYDHIIVPQMPLHNIANLQINFAISYSSSASISPNNKISATDFRTIFNALPEELD